MQAVPVVHDHRCEGPIDWMVNAVDAVIATAAAKLGIELREPLHVIYADAEAVTALWRQLSLRGIAPQPSRSPISFCCSPCFYVASERALVIGAELTCENESWLLEEYVLQDLLRHLLHTQFTCSQIRAMVATATQLSLVLRAGLDDVNRVCGDQECLLTHLFAHWVLGDDGMRFPPYMTPLGSAAVQQFIEEHGEGDLDLNDLPPTTEQLLAAADSIFACVSGTNDEIGVAEGREAVA